LLLHFRRSEHGKSCPAEQSCASAPARETVEPIDEWGPTCAAGTLSRDPRFSAPGKFPFPSVLTQPGNSPGRVCDGLDQGYLHSLRILFGPASVRPTTSATPLRRSYGQPAAAINSAYEE